MQFVILYNLSFSCFLSSILFCKIFPLKSGESARLILLLNVWLINIRYIRSWVTTFVLGLGVSFLASYVVLNASLLFMEENGN